MILSYSDISDLIDGIRDPIWVGKLPDAISNHLGLPTPHIYLSKNSLVHIFIQHQKLTRDELLLLPFVVKHGMIVKSFIEPRKLLINYQNPGSPKRYMAIMKMAGHNTESWLVSFYRAHRRQCISMQKKGKIIKTHS